MSPAWTATRRCRGGERRRTSRLEQTIGQLVDQVVGAADSATEVGQWYVAANALEQVIAAGCTALDGTARGPGGAAPPGGSSTWLRP